MAEQKTQTEEKGIVGAVAQTPAPRQFGKPSEPEPIRRQKKIVVMRHGEYVCSSCGEHLNSCGKRQVADAAERLKELVAGKNAIILTSPASRAVETAELLGEKLGIAEIKKDERLAMDNSEGCLALIEELPRIDAQVVILVTHLCETDTLLFRLGQGAPGLEKGQFAVADL